MGNAF